MHHSRYLLLIFSFDPICVVRSIGPLCIASHFEAGWTTISTCPPEAKERWFAAFKTHYRWMPEHNDQVRGNFMRKCAKILSDGWGKRREGKSKGPKWAHPEHIEEGKKREAADPKLAERVARGKQNYKGEVSRRGPSKHRGGPKPAHFHKGALEKELNRPPLPEDYYRRFKVTEDGTYLENDGRSVLERLEENTRQVQMRHPDVVTLPEAELIEGAAKIVGVSRRTGCPRVVGIAASLVEGSRFTNSSSQSSVNTQMSTTGIKVEVERFDGKRDFALWRQRMREFLCR